MVLGWVSEPDPDRGDVDGCEVDDLALVVAGGHGAGAAELVDGAFDDVSLLVDLGIEVGWAPAVAASGSSVRGLVAGLGDGGRIRRRRWARIRREEYALSASTRSGRRRGRPGPGRAMRT